MTDKTPQKSGSTQSKPTMNPELGQLALRFLERVDLKGGESRAHVLVCEEIARLSGFTKPAS